MTPPRPFKGSKKPGLNRVKLPQSTPSFGILKEPGIWTVEKQIDYQ